jgi:hypothetical protein
MNLYNTFNVIEAGLWGIVALVIAWRTPRHSAQQRLAVLLGSGGFLAFGMTDLAEVGRDGALPLWLWGCKIACGVTILAARYTWRGWGLFRWRDREVLFGAACLLAVALIIWLQSTLGRLPSR